MDCEQACHAQRRASVAEKPFSKQKEYCHDGRVQQQAGQMKTVGQWTEDLVAEKESDRHDRPVIVGGRVGVFERPNCCGQHFAHVPEAVHVGIVDDLGLIVINVSKIIPEDARIRHYRQQQQNRQWPRPR